MKTHVLFDFDGTLVDSASAILSCFERVLRVHGLQPRRAVDAGLIGPPLRQTLESLSGSNDSALLDALCADFRDIYDTQACLETPAYDDITAVLGQMGDMGLTLAIATNKRQAPTRAIIEALGWRHLFVEVLASDSNPDRYADKAGMIGALLEDLQVAPEAALYIGDTVADGVAAAANAVEFWPVAWGYGRFPDHERPLGSPQDLLQRLVMS